MTGRLGRIIDDDLAEVPVGPQRARGDQPYIEKMGEIAELIHRREPFDESAGRGTPLRLATCSNVPARTVPSRCSCNSIFGNVTA
jgi:hypothetical protein